MTVLYLEGIKNADDYQNFMISAFEKNLATDGAFEATLSSFKVGADNKAESTQEESLRMKIVV